MADRLIRVLIRIALHAAYAAEVLRYRQQVKHRIEVYAHLQSDEECYAGALQERARSGHDRRVQSAKNDGFNSRPRLHTKPSVGLIRCPACNGSAKMRLRWLNQYAARATCPGCDARLTMTLRNP